MLYIYHVSAMTYVPLRDILVVGRTTGDLVIPDSSLSSKHMQFMLEKNDSGDTELYVMDLGSKNRTMVNRAEIIPDIKVKVSDGYYVELGTQGFIITKNKAIQYQEINSIVDTFSAKQAVKLEGVQAVASLKEGFKKDITRLLQTIEVREESIRTNEAMILKIQQNCVTLDENLEKEFKKMEEAKARLQLQVQERKQEFDLKIKQIQVEIEEQKKEIETERAMAEAKQKKLLSTRVPGME